MKNKQNKTLLLTYLPTNLLTSAAFTMAEILLSLTIIGVVAAITLPSLTGNINERTWATQKKALYSRFSQAIALMPTMNGYGVGATDADTIAKASETFITSGLSKVLKINNICGPDNARFDCGFSSKITNGENTKIDLPVDISALNVQIPETGIGGTAVAIKNTKAAAFETANGESVLAFYNPNCTAANVLIRMVNSAGAEGLYAKQQVCANFVFDLNGKKGPNTFGKDIGIITAVYSSDSKVVMPMQPRALSSDMKHADASKECHNLENGEYRLPNIDELMSIYYNKSIVGNIFSNTNNHAWSATSIDSDTAYTFGGGFGVKYFIQKDTERGVVCVQR